MLVKHEVVKIENGLIDISIDISPDRELELNDILIVIEDRLNIIFYDDFKEYIENQSVTKDFYESFLERLLLRVNDMVVRIDDFPTMTCIKDNKFKFNLTNLITSLIF